MIENVTFTSGAIVDTYEAPENFVLTNYQEGDTQITASKKVTIKHGSELIGFYLMDEEEAETIKSTLDALRKAERASRRKSLETTEGDE